MLRCIFRYPSQMRFGDVITVKEWEFSRRLDPDLEYYPEHMGFFVSSLFGNTQYSTPNPDPHQPGIPTTKILNSVSIKR